MQVDAEEQLLRSYMEVVASEDWSSEYDRDPDSHAKLIRAEAMLERDLRRFFREMSVKAEDFVDWIMYYRAVHQVHAAASPVTVDVVVNETPLDATNTDFINVVFDDLVLATTAGALSGQAIYGYEMGYDSLHTTTSRHARTQVAQLVGRKVDKDGMIVDNPSAKYKISNTTRDDIRESLRNSISLGEDQKAAVERLRKTIADPRRAELIAQTEAVNSFQGGLLTYGKATGAVAKQSQTIGAIDNCRIYASMGIVDIDFKYGGRFLCPAYHPRCRCGCRLVYQAELDAIK